MDRLLIRQVATVSGLAALAYVLLRADGPSVLAVGGVVTAVAAAVGVAALVRLVVISERDRLRR